MSVRSAPSVIELEVTDGLESLARAELSARAGVPKASIQTGPGWIRTTLDAPSGTWRSLRLAESVFRVETFDVPRPKALLGDAHFKRLARAVAEVIAGYPEHPTTFSLAAAGSGSSVLLRLRDSLANATGLRDSGDAGDLQIRLFRARLEGGWDVLLRLTSRPLSARAWRVCSFPGALNATVASAMAQLTLQRPDQVVVNLMSGSGSILIERLMLGPAAQAIGIETDGERVICAAKNAQAAGKTGSIRWLQSDARSIPLPARSVHALAADLPFGQRVGTHADNLRLYPAVFGEAAQVACRGARFAVLTHEVNLLERMLREQSDWRMLQTLRLNLRGLHPRLYVLERT